MSEAAAADEDDLYADMEDTKPAAKGTTTRRTNSSSNSSSTAIATRNPKPLTEHVQELQQQVDNLKHENKILQRNMGTLYRTAMAELKRKDAQILELQEQLSRSGTTATEWWPRRKCVEMCS